MATSPDLLTGWGVACWPLYLTSAVAVSTVARLVLTLLKWIDSPSGNETESFKKLLLGESADKTKADYLHSFILGFLEAAVYPVLMYCGRWEFVGGWLAFKTFGQWKAWTIKRQVFTRCLIGNALVLIGAYVLARMFLRAAGG